jgi:hypothetical protein
VCSNLLRGLWVVFFYFSVCHGLFFVAIGPLKKDCKISEKNPLYHFFVYLCSPNTAIFR